jgi:hypothetical protein
MEYIMDVLKFLSQVGGEILANKARVTVGNKIIIIARMNGHVWEPTDEGLTLFYKTNEAEAKQAEDNSAASEANLKEVAQKATPVKNKSVTSARKSKA